MEEGSRIQVVRQPNGTTRDLSVDEAATIAENEEVEAFAAEQLRQEEAQLMDDFVSEDLREWEDWAKGEARSGPGVNRARVQVLAQGEGGRLIKKENWLVGLKEGEFLAYSVSVHRYDEDAEAPDPHAASSGGDAAAVGTEGVDGIEADVSDGGAADEEGLLPVTGEAAPDMWSVEDHSRPRNFSVDDFTQTALAEKFYQGWKNKEITDNLIGRRFGYGVLGGFYGRRDWEAGTFREQETDAARGREEELVVGLEPELMDSHVTGGQAVTGSSSASGGPHLAASLVNDALAPEPGHAPAAEEASAAVPSTEVSSERDAEGSSARGSGRQLSLAHWLL